MRWLSASDEQLEQQFHRAAKWRTHERRPGHARLAQDPSAGGEGAAGAAAGNRGAARPAGAGSTDVPAATDVDGDVAQSKPRAVVTGVAAELREFAKLRDEGILTDQEYTEQKNRLLGR